MLISFFRLLFSTILILIATLINCEQSSAEPWLGNRFAQNCAACHSPARRNVKASKRRCTLSCQGCHVNPNGGGMRNKYGDWLGKYWLKSHNVSAWADKNLAPLKKQKYAKQPRGGFNNDKSNDSKTKSAEHKFEKIVTTDKIVDESDFDKSDGESEITVQNDREFMQRLTENDPYVAEMEQLVTGGGDARYFWINGDNEDNNWLMALDFGIRARPRTDYVTAVVETRFSQGPTQSSEEKMLTNGARLRSAYVLVDKLPYNTYVMHGLYRPQIGNYTADHTDLAQNLAGFNQFSRYKATTIGTAPNVPFFNLHIISPHADSAQDQSDGLAFNTGLRFVTLGGFIGLSGWQTKDKGTDLKREVYTYNIGGTFKIVTANIELLNFRNEIETGRFGQGAVVTVDLKTKLWREYYLMTKIAQSNTAGATQEGQITDTIFGIKAFPLRGLDVEIASINRVTEADATSTTQKSTITNSSFQWQAHLYF